MMHPARPRILFVGETVTLAHVTRPYVLARSLDPRRYDVHFACDQPGDFVLGRDPGFTRWRIHSLPGERFLHNISSGRPAFDQQTLEQYVDEDLELLDRVRPDLVVGDLRLSLGVSAQVAGVPYAALVNAHYSPFTRRVGCPVPEMPINRLVGVAVSQAVFRWTKKIVFALHALPLNAQRRRFGLPPLDGLMNAFTHGDYCWYTDLPQLTPTYELPPAHRFLGPILWEPDIARPDWWNRLDPARPLVYVTLGSSGQVNRLPDVVAALAELPVQVAVATAKRLQMTTLPDNVFAADYLPGSTLARRAALVICNGGSATSYQALAVGTPVLGIGSNMDQLLTMQCLENRGAGLLIRSSHASKNRLRRTVVQMLGDPGYHESAEQVAAEMADCNAVSRFHAELENLFGRSLAKSA